jgi:hypothetical protein
MFRLVLSAAPQAGLTLPTPEGIPVEAVTPDVCLSMVAAVPVELGSVDIRAATEAVQLTATGLQVCSQLHHCPAIAACADMHACISMRAEYWLQ